MKLYKQKLLTNAQLKKLNEHKYSYKSDSFLDSFLQPWWNYLVSKTPIWLAPNLITLVGLFVNVLTALILIAYSPDAKTEAPRWTYFLCAVGLFIYQSLDAIDGKQARRTNSANPLGELFDHGCDSISTIFVALSACLAAQLGNYPNWMFFQCFCAITLFYCAHWQTYVSGTLKFGKVDVTEAQFTIMIIHMVSAIFGPSIWNTKVFGSFTTSHMLCTMFFIGYFQVFLNFLEAIRAGGCGKNGSTVAIPATDMEIRTVGLYIACVQYLLHARTYFRAIFTEGAGKNGSTVAGTSVLSPIIPFSMVLVPAFIIYRKSIDHVYEEHPALYIMAFGIVAAKVTNKLVVAHMTVSEMEYMDVSLVGPAMLFFNQYFNTFLPEYAVLWLCMIWVTLDLFRYCSQVCLEICDHLHVELFRIPSPGDPLRVTVPSTALSLEKNGASDSDMSDLGKDDGIPLLHS
ncbi:cholinephosphotransferase 1 isoform X2 [Agrilus planipennis]|uniref:diacylglycerol cholinephosphotransferase n=1 Tax=Agrilus planipennis TaxID=224129 RepID=A0A1W4X303_AGRPL|nr:cholinephosphotransferase 1 isoform X2 [Agrilus planipennis]